jgi:hypothetical protein
MKGKNNMLKHGDARAIVSITRPEVKGDACDEGQFTKDICKFTTWRSDIINKILENTALKHVIQPGDHISISIEINKDATW